MKTTNYNLAYFKGYIPNKESSKILEFLKRGDFKSAETKKLVNTNYFRAKISYENRLLFTFLKYQNETYIVILETILNHKYEKSKFLRGIKFDEEDIDFNKIEIEESIYLNQKKELRYIDKFISFSQEQEDILQLQPPILVVGSAGSGKTSVTIEKLRELKGNVLYISLSNYLVQNSKKICGEGYDNIDFLNFDNFLQRIEKQEFKEITFREFKKWAFRHKITNVEQYYEEFKGVLTGVYHSKYLSKEEYLNLGVKQSLFKQEERENVYNYFEKYLKYLKEDRLYDKNILASNLLKQVEAVYDYIVIDEVQDFSNIQIFFILKSLKNPQNFIFSGDSNQIIYANFFSWSKLKEMLFKQLKDTKIKILTKNYRSSNSVINISNRLLKIKQLRFGSIDKESNYLINKASSLEGSISYHKTNHKLYNSFNKSIQNSTEFAIIVFDEESKIKIKEKFSTPLIFTVSQSKGLEYKNVILVNFIEDNNKIFNEIISGINSNLLTTDELKYSRPKNKENHEIDQYKIYINSLYVAFTRAIENLYIIENRKHKLLDLLEVNESKNKKIDVKISSKEEWIKEAQKLKEMGKEEQADAILNKIKELKLNNIESQKKKNPKESLREKVFSGTATEEEITQLFEQAKIDIDFEIIEKMAEELNFKRAKSYIKYIDSVSADTIVTMGDKHTLLEAYIKRGRSVKHINVGKLISDFFYIFEKSIKDKPKNKKNDERLLKNFIKKHKEGNIELFKLLIKNGAKIHEESSFFAPPTLFDTCRHNLFDIAKLLIERGVDVNVLDRHHATPLLGAVDCRYNGNTGFSNIVKLLLENGANPNISGYEDKSIPLIVASAFGHIGVVKLLLKYNADVNIPTKNGITALILASTHGHFEIVKELVKYGADIHMKETQQNLSAYSIAKLRGHKKIVKFLKKYGAKETIEDVGEQVYIKGGGIIQQEEQESGQLYITDGDIVVKRSSFLIKDITIFFYKKLIKMIHNKKSF